MFIAGFAYYEVGRWGSGNRDTAYLVLSTGALVSAILTAAVGSLFSTRLAVCEAAASWRGAAFARRGMWVVRATHRYYLLAVTLYLASLARAGYQYYPERPGARLVPTAFACASLAAFVHGHRIVVAAYTSAVYASTPAATGGGGGGTDCPRATYLHQHGSAVSTLMLFVMGFTQAGVTRFKSSHLRDTEAGSELLGMSIQAGLYLGSASLAFSCAAFAVFTTCSILVSLYSLSPGRRGLFITNIEQVWRCVELASLVALLSFNVSFATVGWGVGYTSHRYIPAVLAYLSLLVLAAVALTLLHAALTNPSSSVDKSDDTLLERAHAVEAKLHTIALRSSITAGYVWYHLATFATDVNSYETSGVCYLTVHALAFALGLTSCTVAHVTNVSVSNSHKESLSSMVQVAQVIEQLVGLFYWLSLVFFLCGFALIGPVKRGTAVTVWLAVLAITGLVSTCLILHWQNERKAVTIVSGDGDSNENTITQNEKLADQAFQSSGSFGYFCALFLNVASTPGNEPTVLLNIARGLGISTTAVGRQLAVLYCWTMGGSFTVALCLVALSTMLSITGTQRWLSTLFRYSHIYAITSFQLGFILLGAQGQTVGYVVLLCGGGSLVLLVSGLTRVVLPRILQPHSLRSGSQPVWKHLVSAFRAERTSFSVADPQLSGCPMTRVSDGFLELTGYTREEVLGVNCRFLQGPKTDKATVARVRAAVAEGKDITVRLLNYRKDGTCFWNLLQLEHVYDRHDKPVSIIGRQMDITADMQQILRSNRAGDEGEGDSCRNSETVAMELASPRAALNWRRVRASFVDRVAAGTAPSAVLQLQFGSTVKQLQQLQQESCFVASNVFFELLFARTVPVDRVSNAVFLGGALMTFCLAACVNIVSSTTLAFTATHSALDSSSAAVHASRQVALCAMALMLGCMLCWMASVCASGAVKYPEHGSVSAWCAGCGLVAMVLHALQISAISRCVAASKDDKALLADEAWTKEMSAVESTVCAFLPMATDAIETHQLWWRVASGYLVAVFVAELLADCNPWSATSTWWDISWARVEHRVEW
jgi:PAS domain S-box-containing protein